MSGATESMKRAAFEVRKITNRSCKNDDLIDCGVSIDESWQSKCFAWFYLQQGNKVIDAAVLSKFYKGCQIWQKKEGMNSRYAHKIAR